MHQQSLYLSTTGSEENDSFNNMDPPNSGPQSRGTWKMDPNNDHSQLAQHA